MNKNKNFTIIFTIILFFLALSIVEPVYATHTATYSNTPISVSAGSSTLFTLTVTNTGTKDAINNVTLTVATNFTSITAGAGPTGWTGVVNGYTITWTSGGPKQDIKKGKSGNFSWSATAPSQANTYTHSVTTRDSKSGTYSGSVTTIVTSAPEFPLGLGLAFTLCSAIYIIMKKEKSFEKSSKVK